MASDGHCCRACELTLWRAAVRKSLPREKIFSLFWKLLLKNNTQVHCVCIFSGAQWQEFESERNTACFCENRKKGGEGENPFFRCLKRLIRFFRNNLHFDLSPALRKGFWRLWYSNSTPFWNSIFNTETKFQKVNFYNFDSWSLFLMIVSIFLTFISRDRQQIHLPEFHFSRVAGSIPNVIPAAVECGQKS